MSKFLNPRLVILFLVWTLPLLACVVLGSIALYQTGWLRPLLLAMLPMYLLSWLIGVFWRPTHLSKAAQQSPLQAAEFWTAQDTAAIELVEQFRRQVRDLDRNEVLQYERYVHDAKQMGVLLAQHYQRHKVDSRTAATPADLRNAATPADLQSDAQNALQSDPHTANSDGNALHPLTVVDVLALIHLAVEDLETWVLENVPGSTLATLGQLQRLPRMSRAYRWSRHAFFLGTAFLQPAKLLTYPLWSESSRVTVPLQNELVRSFYQMYLRQVGYYLIEMYSGRLRAGSRAYRQHFQSSANIMHQVQGDMQAFSLLASQSTRIAVIGQAGVGKSRLVQLLARVLPGQQGGDPPERASTIRPVVLPLPDSEQTLTVIDTPGYDDANVSRRQREQIDRATHEADLVLMVMAANQPAHQGDVQAIGQIHQYFEEHPHLRQPAILGVVTHGDQLRPIREWSPPYNWRQPSNAKEKSIHDSIEYLQQLFKATVVDFAVVYTGENRSPNNPSDGTADAASAHDADVHSGVDELLGLIINHLPSAQATATLRAYHDRISKGRFEALAKQVVSLIKRGTTGK